MIVIMTYGTSIGFVPHRRHLKYFKMLNAASVVIVIVVNKGTVKLYCMFEPNLKVLCTMLVQQLAVYPEHLRT